MDWSYLLFFPGSGAGTPSIGAMLADRFCLRQETVVLRVKKRVYDYAKVVEAKVKGWNGKSSPKSNMSMLNASELVTGDKSIS